MTDEQQATPQQNDSKLQPVTAAPDPTTKADAELKGDMSGRIPGFWQTRYPEAEARRGIRIEGVYLAVLLILSVPAVVALTMIDPKSPNVLLAATRLYGFAAVGGLLGGWMFTVRWLINSVATWRWDEDRHLWRFLNPFVAAVLALAFFALIRSGLFQVFSPQSVANGASAIAIGFLVGLFSDRAIGKLGDVADTIFGTKHGMIDRPSDPTPVTQTLRTGTSVADPKETK